MRILAATLQVEVNPVHVRLLYFYPAVLVNSKLDYYITTKTRTKSKYQISHGQNWYSSSILFSDLKLYYCISLTEPCTAKLLYLINRATGSKHCFMVQFTFTSFVFLFVWGFWHLFNFAKISYTRYYWYFVPGKSHLYACFCRITKTFTRGLI